MAENLSLFKVRNSGPTCASLLPFLPACSSLLAAQDAAKVVLERHWVPRGPERGLAERRVARPKKCQIEMRSTASDACVNGRVCPATLSTTKCVPPARKPSARASLSGELPAWRRGSQAHLFGRVTSRVTETSRLEDDYFFFSMAINSLASSQRS
jgi:hypothetical protein